MAAGDGGRGERYETPRGEVLLRVFLHGEHHRGQIARAVREAGREPVNADFIQSGRERPAPAGP